MKEKHQNFIEKYKNCTIAQAKAYNYNGQAQIQPNQTLWLKHLNTCQHRIIEELENQSTKSKVLSEITVSTAQFHILKKYHQQQQKIQSSSEQKYKLNSKLQQKIKEETAVDQIYSKKWPYK